MEITSLQKRQPQKCKWQNWSCTLFLVLGTMLFLRVCPAGTLWWQHACWISRSKIFSTISNFHLVSHKLINLFVQSFIHSFIHLINYSFILYSFYHMKLKLHLWIWKKYLKRLEPNLSNDRYYTIFFLTFIHSSILLFIDSCIQYLFRLISCILICWLSIDTTILLFDNFYVELIHVQRTLILWDYFFDENVHDCV